MSVCFRSLVKNFCIYSAGAVLLRLLTSGSSLAMIEVLSPAQFGLLAMLNTLILVLPVVLGLGLRQVLAIEYHANQGWFLTGQLATAYLVSTIPIMILLLLFPSPFNAYWLAGAATALQIRLALIVAWLSFFPDLLFQLLRFQGQAVHLTIAQLVMGLLVAGGTWGFVIGAKLGLLGALGAQCLAQLFLAFYLLAWLLFYRLSWSMPSLSQVGGYLRVGLPFVPNILLAVAIVVLNRWLIVQQAGLGQMGIYALAEGLSFAFQALLLQPLINATLPLILASFKAHPTQVKELDHSSDHWIILGATTIKGLFLASYFFGYPFLEWLLPSKFLPALPLLIPLIGAQILFSASQLTSASLQYFKQTHRLVLFMALSLLVGITVNLCLVSTYGVWAGAWAMNAAYLFYFLAVKSLKWWYF
jgi:O-antigen/teichoic acid export membrane protein